MRRLVGGGLVVLGAFALIAAQSPGPAMAAKRKALSTTLPSDATDLPVPPIPPAQPQYRDAPLPSDVPAPGQAASSGVTVSPDMFQPKDFNLGQGYMDGSTVQGEQRRHIAPTPGVNLSVPLQ